MAKTQGKINKSALIRDALKQHKGKSPTEISAILKTDHNIDVPPAYVSNIKGNLKAKKVGRRVLALQKQKPSGGVGAEGVIPAAVEFIRAAGGLDAARATLEQIAEIARIVG